MIIIKGKHSVLEALQSPIRCIEISYISQKNTHEFKDILSIAQQKNVPVNVYDKSKFEKEFKLSGHQNIVAKINDIPTKPLSSISAEKDHIIVALDHLEDPYNVGAIMRTCEGLGIKNIILPKNRQAPLNSGVIKASSGAAYYLNIIQVSNIAQSINECRKKGFWILGMDSNTGADLSQFEPPLPVIVVMGNEHKGISNIVSKSIHTHINIPMKGNIDSLNVSVSAGIILHHLTRLL